MMMTCLIGVVVWIESGACGGVAARAGVSKLEASNANIGAHAAALSLQFRLFIYFLRVFFCVIPTGFPRRWCRRAVTCVCLLHVDCTTLFLQARHCGARSHS